MLWRNASVYRLIAAAPDCAFRRPGCLREDWLAMLATGAIGEPAATHTGSFAVTTVMPRMLRSGLISKENKPGPAAYPSSEAVPERTPGKAGPHASGDANPTLP